MHGIAEFLSVELKGKIGATDQDNSNVRCINERQRGEQVSK